MVVPRRHLHNFGPGQSMVLPEVVIRGQVSIIARRRHLKKNHNKKSVIICTMTNFLHPIDAKVTNPTATLWRLL